MREGINFFQYTFFISNFRATLNVRQCEAANVGKDNIAELCDFDEHLQRVNVLKYIFMHSRITRDFSLFDRCE